MQQLEDRLELVKRAQSNELWLLLVKELERRKASELSSWLAGDTGENEARGFMKGLEYAIGCPKVVEQAIANEIRNLRRKQKNG